MIRGMTAYAAKHKKIGPWLIHSEIWSYNNKFLQIDLFIPASIRKHSRQIERNIRSKLRRGKVTLKISFSDDKKGINKKAYYNQTLANDIYDISQKQRHKNQDPLQMKDILLMPGVLEIKENFPNFDKLWPSIHKLVTGTLSELIKIKNIEGKNTVSSFRKTILIINKSLARIKRFHKKENTNFARKLKSSVKDISSIVVDRKTLQDEAINFIRNCDISEEISRIDSYLDLLEDTLKSKTPAGKKIDFISQELLREVNTIGSKKDNFSIRKEVVNIKEEIAKIREHSHNIE